jgi:hypothetical protein
MSESGFGLFATIASFLASLALLIMSSIILGSANGLPESDGTKKKNIKNTSTILLGVSIFAVLLTGYKLYTAYKSGSGSSFGGVSYYF